MYFLESFKDFLHLFKVILVTSCTDSYITFFGVDLNHVSVHFAVFLPSYIKFLVSLDVVQLFPCIFFYDHYEMCECEEYRIQVLFLVNELDIKFVQVLDGFLLGFLLFVFFTFRLIF